MKTKNTRFLLIPLALLAVIILAACTPATPTPETNAPMTPGAGMNNGQSGQGNMGDGQSNNDMMGNGQNQDDRMGNGQSNDDMMGGQSQGTGPKNADGFTDITVAQLEARLPNKDFTLVNVHIPFAGNIPQTDVSIPYNEIAQNVDKLPATKRKSSRPSTTRPRLSSKCRNPSAAFLVAEGVLQDVLEPETDDIERELARIGRNQAVEEELARLKASKQLKALPEAA